MKIRKVITLCVMFSLIVLSSCIDTNQEEQEVKITIDFEDYITINESKQIHVSSTLDNDTFTFESSDVSILTVNHEGLISGINIGQTTITITSTSGKVIHHTVTVIPVLFVESISLELEEQAVYYAGVPYTYQIAFYPQNAVNTHAVFSFSDPKVLINESDQTITFIKAGVATLFVYLQDEWNIQSKVQVDVNYDMHSDIYDLLFVGNSLTKYTYNIPMMVKQMIENDGFIVYIDYSTSYQYLDQHELNVTTLLNKNRYTHVILQEKSDGLITDFDRFKQSVLELNDLIIAKGARTILYQTWAYNYPSFEARQLMHDIVTQGYREIALEINASVSLVGEVFMEVMINHPEINLYADLNHPSLFGAYLSALVHYKTITGKSAHHATYKPDTISVEIETIFKDTVDKIIP